MRPSAAFIALSLLTVACGGSAAPATVPSTTTTVETTTTTTADSTSTTVEFLATTSTTEPFEPTVFCFEEPPPPYGRQEDPYTFDPEFYVHYCSASGVFVVGSEKTSLVALEAAAQVIDRVLGHDPQMVDAIVLANHAVILTGEDETAGDLPEWQYEEGRTFAPDPGHPGFASSGGGLGYIVAPADDIVCEVPRARHGSYGTADWGIVLIHELGHLIEETAGLTGLDALYEVGRESGAWDLRHYAMTNPREYWAEVVQVYLGQYEQSRRGFRQPRTRAELREQDPAAFDLAASLLERSTLVQYWCDTYAGPEIDLPEVEAGPETG